jgi:hypothetical protein
MDTRNSPSLLDQDICIHTFTVSAAMVGVCLTVIGIIHEVISLQKINTLADDLLAVDVCVFLCACLLSYWALRTRTARRMHQVERGAHAIFLVGLLFMVLVCGLVVYACA